MVYAEIIGYGFGYEKIRVEVDHGQEKEIYLFGQNREKNPIKKYNSMIDALNTMTSEGWRFVQAYSMGDEKNIIHWIIMKEVALWFN